MKIKTISIAYSLAAILCSAPLLAAPQTSPVEFRVSTVSKVPGATLQPGSYLLHIVNRLSDRLILEVDSAEGTQQSIFIGVPSAGVARPVSRGLVRWSNSVDGSNYLEGYYFPGSSSVVEFVYPKTEAVAIATANPKQVPAVDPASEGKVADNTLSPHDMQLLTLWLLSLEKVGPDGHAPGIKAVRYEQGSSVSHKPVIAALPHTASQLPWIWLIGLCSLLAAAMLRVLRLQRTDAQTVAKSSR
jgi:hypothetical protein